MFPSCSRNVALKWLRLEPFPIPRHKRKDFSIRTSNLDLKWFGSTESPGKQRSPNTLLSSLWIWVACLVFGVATQSTKGILDLVQRRLPKHVNDFEFLVLVNGTANITKAVNDNYVVSSTSDGKILVEGNSLSALSSGWDSCISRARIELMNTSLHRYLTDVVHVDIFWYIGSQLDVGPSTLPNLDSPITGSSIVPWRYHFNTG